MSSRFAVLLLAGSCAAAPSAAFAQSQGAPLQDRWPAPTQQLDQRAPGAASPPAAQPAAPAEAPAASPAAPPAAVVAPAPDKPASPAKPAQAKPKPAAKKPVTPATTVACSGTFAHDATHLSLTNAFKAPNVTFTEIEGGPENTRLAASVIYSNDPKRRLEVMWENEEQRTGIHRIVIGGNSTWTAPKGLHLGLPLQAVEKINGKPFKLQAIEQDGSTSVSDWQDGALAKLPGDCIIGVKFTIDPKAPESARAAADATEFSSDDAALKALKPKVNEVLIGYPEQ